MYNQCEHCLYQAEDIETGDPYCSMHMDQDDRERLMYDRHSGCPYFRLGDDYTVVKKQGVN